MDSQSSQPLNHNVPDGVRYIAVPADRVSKNWEFFRYYIMQALTVPGTNTEFHAGNILAAIIKGNLQCWCAVDRVKGEDNILAVYTTNITVDVLSGCKSLILYSLAGVRNLSFPVINKGMLELKEYAKKHNCSVISAVTGIPNVGKLAAAFSGRVGQVIILEV